MTIESFGKIILDHRTHWLKVSFTLLLKSLGVNIIGYALNPISNPNFLII